MRTHPHYERLSAWQFANLFFLLSHVQAEGNAPCSKLCCILLVLDQELSHEYVHQFCVCTNVQQREWGKGSGERERGEGKGDGRSVRGKVGEARLGGKWQTR